MHDRAADAGALAAAVLWVPLMAVLEEVDSTVIAAPAWAPLLDLWLWWVSCLLVLVRRRRPVAVAVVLALLSAVSSSAAGAMLVGLFGVAVRCRPRAAAGVGALVVAAGAVNALIWQDTAFTRAGNIAFGVVFVLLLVASTVGWGLLIATRRRTLERLRERAGRAEREAQLSAEMARAAEAEAALREERARVAERERITREMHDALGHRLSLLSVHAGALAYRRDASPGEVAAAAAVIRDSAHRALEDLREAIGVLRRTSGDDGASGGTRPQPGLSAIRGLVAESADAGMDVHLTEEGSAAGAEAPGAVARAAYRIVQESLTNARKHAPGAAVSVALSGSPGAGLGIAVLSGPAPATSPSPGSGHGLLGLTERAASAGGSLTHAATPDGGYAVRAHLPWPEEQG
ncbi:sensor histidine kinase [Nocardiopsis coralliicola]